MNSVGKTFVFTEISCFLVLKLLVKSTLEVISSSHFSVIDTGLTLPLSSITRNSLLDYERAIPPDCTKGVGNPCGLVFI